MNGTNLLKEVLQCVMVEIDTQLVTIMRKVSEQFHDERLERLLLPATRLFLPPD